jgi:hypothetical protein
MEKIKVLLVEYGSSHDECLYSQIKILRSIPSVHLTLLCNEKLAGNVSYFGDIDFVKYIKVEEGKSAMPLMLYVWSYIRKHRFQKVIFNTAHGDMVGKLFFFFPKISGTDYYGIAHNTGKLLSSFTQGVITKHLKSYFVLNEYLIHRLYTLGFQEKKLVEFHPVFYPDYPEKTLNKPNHEIWVTIPGQVELKRRDYASLFDSIKTHGLNKHIRLLLLGKSAHAHGDGDFVKKRIEELDLGNQVQLWDDYIDVETFYSIIKHSDYLLPLIHSNHQSGELYEDQITGTFNIAAGYGKTLLMEEEYSEERFKKYSTLFYTKDNLALKLNVLKPPQNTGNPYSAQVWQFETQKKVYAQAIGISFE